jgi:hypothetical protein
VLQSLHFEQRKLLAGALAVCLSLSACSSTPIPDEAYRLPQSALAQREIQTRTFEVSDEAVILQASVALLQDMEYNIDNIEYPLGILTGSKVVDADDARQKALLLSADVAMAILSILTGSTPGGSAYATANDEFGLTVTFVVLPSLEKEDHFTVRATIQSNLTDKTGNTKKVTLVDDPVIYREIFEKLSRSLLLERIVQ